MTSYQSSVYSYSSFKCPMSSAATATNKKFTGSTHNSTFDITQAARAKKKAGRTKKKPGTAVQKLYSASGQAPAPSKDFYELVVYKEEIVFRKWCIRYTKNGKVIPSEDKMDVERFLDSDVVQNDIERNLGNDVLHMAIGHLSNSWLPRLPMHILNRITSYLELKDLGRLHEVSSAFNKRLQNNIIWKSRLQKDFDISEQNGTMLSLKKFYRGEIKKKREAEIDWDNV